MSDQERIQLLGSALFLVCGALENALDQLGPQFEQHANIIEQVAKSLADGFPGAVPIVTQ